MRKVLDGDRRQTVREISNKLDIPKTTVHRVISTDLNMSRVCAKWVPKLLKVEEMERRVSASRERNERDVNMTSS